MLYDEIPDTEPELRRQVMEQVSKCVGLDIHKHAMAVSIADCFRHLCPISASNEWKNRFKADGSPLGYVLIRKCLLRRLKAPNLHSLPALTAEQRS